MCTNHDFKTMIYKLTKDRMAFPNKLNDFYGWREMAHAVDRARFGAPIVAGRHQDAAELAFYLPGQPDVWVFSLRDTAGHLDNRATAFDYFPGRPDISANRRVLFFHGHVEDFCRVYGFVTTENLDGITIPLHGRLRERRFDLCVHK